MSHRDDQRLRSSCAKTLGEVSLRPLSSRLLTSTFTSLLTFAVICLPLLVRSHEQRPFYNIAHMVNSIKEVNYYLSRGANAIEADVAFAPNGSALYTFHGYPCDCFRHCTELEALPKYLEYIREITRPGRLPHAASIHCCFAICSCCCDTSPDARGRERAVLMLSLDSEAALRLQMNS